MTPLIQFKEPTHTKANSNEAQKGRDRGRVTPHPTKVACEGGPTHPPQRKYPTATVLIPRLRFKHTVCLLHTTAAAAPSLHLSISLTLSAIVSLLSTQLLAASSNSLAVSFGHCTLPQLGAYLLHRVAVNATGLSPKFFVLFPALTSLCPSEFYYFLCILFMR